MGGADQNNNEEVSWPTVADDLDVYRLLDKPIWINSEGTVTSLAFRLRPQDEGCISLGLRGLRTEQQFCEEEPPKRSKCVGVAHAVAGQMRTPIPPWSPLDVVQDAEHHACLKGLPLPPPDLLTEEGRTATEIVEYVGNEVAKRVRVIWRK